MPPKVAAAAGDDSTFNFVMSVLKTCDNIKPDWDIVAQENGYGYARNAQARFKDILKKHGFKIDSGKIVGLDGSTAVAPASAVFPKTPKKARKASDVSSGGSGKKRSAKEMEEESIKGQEDDAVGINDEGNTGVKGEESDAGIA